MKISIVQVQKIEIQFGQDNNIKHRGYTKTSNLFQASCQGSNALLVSLFTKYSNVIRITNKIELTLRMTTLTAGEPFLR